MKKKRKRYNGGRKTWQWATNPYGVIKTEYKWTLLATECYIKSECQDCIYWEYCKQNNYQNIPIMKQVVIELYRKLGKPPKRLLDTARRYYYYNYSSNKQGYDERKSL